MINATFIDKDGNVVRQLTQWDINQTLKIDLGQYKLTGSAAVHFCNQRSELAKVVQATVEGQYVSAKIPNTLLTESYPIMAYLYVTEADRSAKSIAYINITVKPRVKPSGYVYTDDVDVVMLTELVAQVDAKLKEVDNKLATLNINVATLDETKAFIDKPAHEAASDPTKDKLVSEESLKYAYDKKLDKNQGVLNKGKFMKVDDNGNLIPDAIPASSVTPQDIQQGVQDYLAKNPIVEKDPTVPEWAKSPTKPTYTAQEVGALPSGTKIPTKTSELQNDSNFTTSGKLTEHDTNALSHNDIRELIKGLTTRLNTALDSTDVSLDQLSEIVAYIKSNKSLIEGVTTNKVNVADIVSNLTTNVANKPLSASMGVELKKLIDAIKVPDVSGFATKTELNGKASQTEVNQLKENLNGFIPKNQGVVNQGKVLEVGADGNVVPKDKPTIPTKLPNPQKLTFNGAVTAEYDGSGAVTVTIPSGASGGSVEVERIEKLASDTTVELTENKLYIFPEMASLTYTLKAPTKNNVVNEYHFVFKSGASATQLVHALGVNIGSFKVEPNKIYEISIMENLLTSQSWAVV